MIGEVKAGSVEEWQEIGSNFDVYLDRAVESMEEGEEKKH
jgi:hypothetical protein